LWQGLALGRGLRYSRIMAPHPKRPRDLNQWARHMVDIATGAANKSESAPDSRDHLAVELGRRGGLKGGKARAEKLSPEERAAIARKAAKTRWSREQN
jgi:hypothetical protein